MKEDLVVLAALSFEERCTAATQEALGFGNKPASVVMIDYGSSVTRGSDATVLRQAHWKVIKASARDADVEATRLPLDGCSMEDMRECVLERGKQGRRLLVDISCMTRPHLLGLAAALAESSLDFSWSIAYTKPLTYGDLNSPAASGGWRDSLWLPLGDEPILRNQGLAIGLLAAGHEADRCNIALKEIEPAAGIAMFSSRRDRPDFHRVAVNRNGPLFSYLRGLRMPGPRGRESQRFFEGGGWEVVEIHMESVVGDVFRVVARIVQAASVLDSPIILIPFGPKLVVFLAAWALANECPNRSWAIYPVARTHSLEYSDGVLATEVHRFEELEGVRESVLG